jgi:hypothetical protein
MWHPEKSLTFITHLPTVIYFDLLKITKHNPTFSFLSTILEKRSPGVSALEITLFKPSSGMVRWFMVESCDDYRESRRLPALRNRLAEGRLTPEEKFARSSRLIQELEKKLRLA